MQDSFSPTRREASDYMLLYYLRYAAAIVFEVLKTFLLLYALRAVLPVLSARLAFLIPQPVRDFFVNSALSIYKAMPTFIQKPFDFITQSIPLAFCNLRFLINMVFGMSGRSNVPLTVAAATVNTAAYVFPSLPDATFPLAAVNTLACLFGMEVRSQGMYFINRMRNVNEADQAVDLSELMQPGRLHPEYREPNQVAEVATAVLRLP